MRCLTNGTVNLQCDVVQIKYNIRRINPNKSDAKVYGFSSKICLTMSTYELLVIYLCIKLKFEAMYVIICTREIDVNSYRSCT